MYPSNTSGWEAMISVFLSSPTCLAKASLVAPLVAAIKLFGLTVGGSARSILRPTSYFWDYSKAAQQRLELVVIERLERLQERESKKGPMV